MYIFSPPYQKLQAFFPTIPYSTHNLGYAAVRMKFLIKQGDPR